MTIIRRIQGTIIVPGFRLDLARRRARRLLNLGEELGSGVQIAGAIVFPIIRTGTVEGNHHGSTKEDP